ncbi:MAG TPA: methionyl-tRNA formyltransferase [Pyrinomonadaceae bacterium]|nr:methionyl-tRNA formyltransferase [Pyrinomonadaceae bacterium]
MRIVFMGTPQSAVPCLQQLLRDGHEVVAVWTQPDRPAGRGDKMHAPPVKTFALQHALRVEQPARIKTDEAKELFAAYQADLAVVVAYGRILPAEYLNAPAMGCINVHFSLLPSYRGAAPVNWAIINGEQKTGVTTMFVEEQLDSGPILLQQETEIRERETATELMQRLSETGAQLLSETLGRLSELTPLKQDESRATFAPLLVKRDGHVDWANSAVAIERRVRGLQPWPNAYTSWKNQRLILWDTTVEATENSPSPGEVLTAHGDAITIACGDSSLLRIHELQLEGKRRMSARDFLNGTHLKVGDRFGD